MATTHAKAWPKTSPLLPTQHCGTRTQLFSSMMSCGAWPKRSTTPSPERSSLSKSALRAITSSTRRSHQQPGGDALQWSAFRIPTHVAQALDMQRLLPRAHSRQRNAKASGQESSAGAVMGVIIISVGLLACAILEAGPIKMLHGRLSKSSLAPI